MNSSVTFNANEFHPELRELIIKELDRLTSSYPLFAGSLTLRVAAEATCLCGECNSEELSLENAYATTAMAPDGRCIITFKEALFGVNGDPIALLKQLDEGGNGGMNTPGYVLAHEYGHVFETITMLHFDDRSELVIDSYDAIINTTNDIPAIVKLLNSMNTKLLPPYIEEDGKMSGMPTAYSYKSGDEFFAETFAAMHWGDEKQKALPCVHRMRDFTNTVYSELKRGSN